MFKAEHNERIRNHWVHWLNGVSDAHGKECDPLKLSFGEIKGRVVGDGGPKQELVWEGPGTNFKTWKHTFVNKQVKRYKVKNVVDAVFHWAYFHVGLNTGETELVWHFGKRFALLPRDRKAGLIKICSVHWLNSSTFQRENYICKLDEKVSSTVIFGYFIPIYTYQQVSFIRDKDWKLGGRS